MSSPINEVMAPEKPRRNAGDVFPVWNRRFHYYIGLSLLIFCWLFAFTGLLLNHPKWEFAQFWPNRLQTRIEQKFQGPESTTDLARARDLMRQFGIAGEVQWPGVQPAGGPFSFQVSRPGHIVEVKADLVTGRAMLQRNELNPWGVMHLLHTFTGVRSTDPANERDWVLTTVWALSMDAVGFGLVVMVFSSYIMWYRLKSKRRGGIVALALGFVTCGLFVAGLRWLL